MEVIISVVMATFNGESHIIEQLESLACQSLLPAELVITDDGSTDQTMNLIQAFIGRFKFPVRLIRNDVRLGYGRNFLKAASLARSEYVAFCDQDDIWSKEKIAVMNEVAAEGGYDLIVHGGRVVDASLAELGECFPKVADGLVELDRYSKIFFPGYAMTVRKEFLASLDYQSRIEAADVNFEHDLWICQSILQGGSCFGVSRQLVLYRQHDSNVIGFSALTNSARHATNEKNDSYDC